MSSANNKYDFGQDIIDYLRSIKPATQHQQLADQYQEPAREPPAVSDADRRRMRRAWANNWKKWKWYERKNDNENI